MQNRFGLLDTDMMPIFMIIALNIIITMHFSINCSAVICSPTVIYAILREALVKPMAPVSTFHHISFRSIILVYYLFCNLYFSLYITKIPKIFILLSLSDLTFASGREGIDNPFIALVARFLIVCAGTRRFAWSPTGLIPWFSKTEGNTYATLLHHPFLFKGKPTHAQEVACIQNP